MDKILSIIIPVYNVEKYLVDCLESVLKQCSYACEIILIDDGSTDNSGKTCDIYAEKNDLIKVVHKENGGLASARNEGLKIATGKYLAFLDSDDKISDGAISEILKWAGKSDADLCFMQAIKFDETGCNEDLGDGIKSADIRNKDKDEIYCFLSSCAKYPGSACTKIYRREFIVNNSLFFPKDKRYSEDLGFVRDCIVKAEKSDAIDCPYYEYRQNRAGSITNTINVKKFFDLSLFVTETEELAKTLPDTGRDCCLSFAAYEYVILLYMYNFLSEKKKEAKEFLVKRKKILSYGKTKKIKMTKFFLNLFGVNITSKLLRFYKKTAN